MEEMFLLKEKVEDITHLYEKIQILHQLYPN